MHSRQFRFFVPLCAGLAFGTAHASDPKQIYESLFPYYAEVCSATEISKAGAAPGGQAGHTLMYLKGACRDESHDLLPRVKVCDPRTTDLTKAESGVGVSLDSDFANSKWVAIPGKSLVFNGDLADDELLTEENFERALKHVTDLRTFDQVKFTDAEVRSKPAGESWQHFKASETVGTDFALRFGRSLFCSYVPLTRPMMERVATELNAVNEPYLAGKKNFRWSAYNDNCVHNVHNALAAAGLWSRRPTGKTWWTPRGLLALSIPANEFVFASERGNLGLVGAENDVYWAFKDSDVRTTLTESGWISDQPGAIVEILPIHSAGNATYNLQLGFDLIDWPLLQKKVKAFDRLVTEPRYSDFLARLQNYRERYWRSLRLKKPIDWYRNRDWSDRRIQSQEFGEFYAKYYQYIASQIRIVDEQIRAFDRAE